MEIDENNYKRYLVKRALLRSNVKRRIVEYLSLHGFSYANEIARDIKSTPTNVIGAINGMDNRYKSKHSLIKIGVVVELENKKNDGTRLYCLSSNSSDAVSICRNFNKEIN